jgi:hypothetical protein
MPAHLTTADEPCRVRPDENSRPSFPVAVPDVQFWPWRLASPASRLFSPRPAVKRKGRRAPRLDWLTALVRAEVYRQRSNVLVLPDELLELAFRGGHERPGRPNDRLRWLRHCLLCVGGPGSVRALPAGACPERCCLRGSVVRHRHFVLTVPTALLGDLHTFADHEFVPTDIPAGGKVCGIDAFVPAYRYLEFPGRDRFKNSPAGRRPFGFYLPAQLLGNAAGLTLPQVRLLVSCVAEVTRSGRKRRPDGARVLKKGIGLDGGRWVPAQGNSRANNDCFYSVEVRLRRARYLRHPLDAAGRPRRRCREALVRFFADFRRLSDDLGLKGVILTPRGRERSPETVLQLLKDDCPVSPVLKSQFLVYLSEDYLSRWRRWLEEKAGVTIPDSPAKALVIDDLEALRDAVLARMAAEKVTANALAALLGVHRNALADFLHKGARPRPALRDKLQRFADDE